MDHHTLHHTVDLLGFLTLGLLGGFAHCVGMCAPFVLLVSRRYGNSTLVNHGGVFGAQAWYTAGRITTYTALGALAGALGGAVTMAGTLVGVRRGGLILAGVVLVGWALVALSDLAWLQGSGVARFFRRLGPASLPPSLKRQVPGHPFGLGLVLGLLPCGMVYSAVVAAVARGSAAEGAVALALFGLGTAPALLALSAADRFVAGRRALLNRLAQLFILAMGAWFLWRGFSG